MENKSARAKVRLLVGFDCNGHPQHRRFYCLGFYNRIVYSYRLDAE